GPGRGWVCCGAWDGPRCAEKSQLLARNKRHRKESSSLCRPSPAAASPFFRAGERFYSALSAVRRPPSAKTHKKPPSRGKVCGFFCKRKADIYSFAFTLIVAGSRQLLLVQAWILTLSSTAPVSPLGRSTVALIVTLPL